MSVFTQMNLEKENFKVLTETLLQMERDGFSTGALIKLRGIKGLNGPLVLDLFNKQPSWKQYMKLAEDLILIQKLISNEKTKLNKLNSLKPIDTVDKWLMNDLVLMLIENKVRQLKKLIQKHFHDRTDFNQFAQQIQRILERSLSETDKEDYFQAEFEKNSLKICKEELLLVSRFIVISFKCNSVNQAAGKVLEKEIRPIGGKEDIDDQLVRSRLLDKFYLVEKELLK